MKKNNDFIDNLSEKMNSDNITLPEKLSAENMAKLIDAQSKSVEPMKFKRFRKTKKAVKWVSAIAATLVIAVGIAAAANLAGDTIKSKKQDNIIAEKTDTQDDYSAVEKVVLSYFKTVTDKNKDSVWLFGTSSSDKATNESASNAATGSDSHSSTNNQVEGVEEADIIQNDGKYIYYLTNSELIIVDGSDAENAKVVSKTKVVENAENNYTYNREMLIKDDTLIIMTQVDTPYYEGDTASSETAEDGVFVSCCYAAKGNTVVRMYDISDKTKPTLTNTLEVFGNYISCRMIDSKLIFATAYDIPYYAVDSTDFEKACDDVKTVSVPMYSLNGGKFERIPVKNIEVVDENNAGRYVVMTMVDIDKPESPYVAAVLGSGYEVYSTKDNFFIAGYFYDNETSKQYTNIYCYKINKNSVDFVTSTKVAGEIIDQFAMDFYNGYFRIATTEYQKGSTENKLTVFDSNLKQVGILGSLANGETIQSVRFIKNTAYVVTFYQTDPLFIIDLSNPAKPVVKGQLKIPGFSSYLHPISENLIVGIGTGGDDNGSNNSAKVSLFDVSDPYNPKEIDSYTVDSAYFDTSHKAFTAVDDNSFILSLTKESYDDSWNYSSIWYALKFSVGPDGITETGRYQSVSLDQSSYYQRNSFIGNTLFMVSESGIDIYNMDSQKFIKTLKF